MTEFEYRLHTIHKRVETAQTRVSTLERMLKATPEDDLRAKHLIEDLRSAQEQLARWVAARDDVLAQHHGLKVGPVWTILPPDYPAPGAN